MSEITPPPPFIVPKSNDLKNRNIELIISNFGLQAVKTIGFVAGQKLFSDSLESRDSGQYQIGKVENNDGIPSESGWNRAAVNASFLGNLVFDQFYFDKFTWVDLKGLSHGVPAVFLDFVLFEITQSKNIITTPLQGYNGTVKEYISDGDYQIKIRGAVVDENAMRYPQEQVNNLYEVCKANQAVPVVSSFLQLFGIYEIVITDFAFPQREGFRNTQMFEITAISDAPINLIITNTQ